MDCGARGVLRMGFAVSGASSTTVPSGRTPPTEPPASRAVHLARLDQNDSLLMKDLVSFLSTRAFRRLS
jgi:hypothetical protein